jgi:hypothetical protein
VVGATRAGTHRAVPATGELDLNIDGALSLGFVVIRRPTSASLVCVRTMATSSLVGADPVRAHVGAGPGDRARLGVTVSLEVFGMTANLERFCSTSLLGEVRPQRTPPTSPRRSTSRSRRWRRSRVLGARSSTTSARRGLVDVAAAATRRGSGAYQRRRPRRRCAGAYDAVHLTRLFAITAA